MLKQLKRFFATALLAVLIVTLAQVGLRSQQSNPNSLQSPGQLWNVIPAATNTNIAATTMFTPGVASNYRFTYYVDLTAVGVGCTGSTTVVVNAIFTDPNAAAAQTVALATVTIATSGNGTLGQVASGTYAWRNKAASAIQYSTSGYTAGAGCTTNPTYQIVPVLETLA